MPQSLSSGLLRDKPAAFADYGTHSQALIDRVIAEVAPYTMVKPEGLECTIRLTLSAINAGIPGDLIECGTWLGGCSFAMLLAQRYAFGEIMRPVWMFDSFEGLPPAGPNDGQRAKDWQANANNSPKHYNNCSASLDEMLQGANALGVADYVMPMEGWFNETLQLAAPDIGKIALLRLDGDWYESVKVCLDQLAGLVSEGAPIIVDDYFAWRGATLATHEYLAKNQLPWRIRSTPKNMCAWMLKEQI